MPRLNCSLLHKLWALISTLKQAELIVEAEKSEIIKTEGRIMALTNSLFRGLAIKKLFTTQNCGHKLSISLD